MKVIREPSVYVIGRQTIDQAELDRFLEDHDVAWESDSEVAGEVIAETAGRVCYMSFAKPRPGGNKAYLDHIKEVGHGCYDAATDVLTIDGWKNWAEVTEADRFATLDPATRQISYHHPKRLVRYPHKGRMYRVESQHVDLLVTPDHKMLVCPTTTKLGRCKQDYSLIAAQDLGSRSHAYLKCGSWAGGWWTTCPGRDVMALLGFAIGDGCVSGPGASTVRFHLKRERKISWLRSVCCRLKEKGFSLEASTDDRYTVRLPDNGLVRTLFGGIYDDDGQKRIPQATSVLTGASLDGLEGLFEGLMQSDGHEGATCDSFDTTSPVLVDQFQHLCLHLGLAANVCYTYGPERRITSYGDKPLTRLGVIRGYLKPEVNKWSGCDGKTYWVNDWEGEVFCAEVQNNTLYVRRNGKPVWSGNSVLEHAVWNLLITGVSRSLTHELVRHRSGFGYSQLSQRYVDESVAEYVCPDVISNDPELLDIWIGSVKASHDAYVKIATILADRLKPKGVIRAESDPAYMEQLGGLYQANATERRKAARQAARSVLPNATETKIFVTGNARALRHFLEQRGSVHAEPEIRKLANKMLDVLQAESPNLFGDYKRQPLPDGTFAISTDWMKV